MALGRGGMGCLRGASWLGIVAGSVASTAISALQWRHLTFTKLPTTRRRYRSSPSENREPHAGQETLIGIFHKTPEASPAQPLSPPFARGSIGSSPAASSARPYS